MNLKITSPDPFKILESTKFVMDNAKHVMLNDAAVSQNAIRIGKYLQEHGDFPDHGHRLVGNFKIDIQLIFFQAMLGFCFWSSPGKPKWGIEMPDGEKVDGWYGVAAAFKRAFDEGIPVTDVDFLMRASKEDIKNILRSCTEAEIPLLEERVSILNENARSLKNNFDGQAENLLQAAENDAVLLVELLLKHFSSFRDVAKYKTQEVVFLKIAHLLALDIEYRLSARSQRPFLKNFNQLSVFADYKLPQLLRQFGILEYKEALAARVDVCEVIPAGSEEEVEIRAGAIWGVELLKQVLSNYSAIQIGHVIWLTSQDQSLQSKIKPYHRTLTTYY